MKVGYTASSYRQTAVKAAPFWRLAPAVLLALFFGNAAANAQCNIQFEDITANCDYNNGATTFTVEVQLSWSFAPGTTLELTVGNQTQTLSNPPFSGSHTFTGFTLPAPAFGYPVLARFAGPAGCVAVSTVDAIACTPACSDSPDAMGGFVWKDENSNGLYEGEPGQPNVKAEVYDCEGVLVGTTYTNADGQWGIEGLSTTEEYRIEFSASQIPGMSPARMSAENGTGVQFATAGNCAVNTSFVDETAAEDCSNPDNIGSSTCDEVFNTLDWGQYANGAIPFPTPPYSKAIGQDYIYWSRSTDDATAYAHRVFHLVYGGADAFYYLEIDADNTTSAGGAGAVFSFDRPVGKLSFTILDIDITGDAIDRVGVQGYLGGVPVELSMADVEAGSQVSILDPGLYEGTATVDDASTSGNVTVTFSQPVDQVAIHLVPAASGAANPGVQAVGIGDISWCSEPIAIEPACMHILDWMAFTDGDSSPMPVNMGGMEASFSQNDPSGIATPTGMEVDNDRTPQGGQRGFWALSIDAASAGQYIENIFTFSLPVEELSFSLLDIDQAEGQSGIGYQDKVSVHGYRKGVEVSLSLSDILAVTGVQGNSVQVVNPNTYLGGGTPASSVSPDGNIRVSFPGPVDSLAVRFEAGAGGPANPGLQSIGISDLNFCVCRPMPVQLGNLAWEDENGNGIQEACEPPLAGLPVTLYDGEGQLVATTTTDDNGQYHFTASGTEGENWPQPGQVAPGMPYFIVFGDDNANPDEQFVVVGNEAYESTLRQAAIGTYKNDSDPDPDNMTNDMPGVIPDGLPYISITTPGAGQANHTLDAGFSKVFFDLALRKTLNTDLTAPPFIPGELLTYTITVYNQGDLIARNLGIADYLPPGLALLDTDNWYQTGNTLRYQSNLPNLAPGDSLSVDITFRINNNFPGGLITNAAEIFRAENGLDAPDIDSDFDLNRNNDAGGAPGSPADNAIGGDGTGVVNGMDALTDEDDHDVEQVFIESASMFDLALDLALQGNGPIYPGDEITFNIEVINEGILPATMVYLRNYIPNGLILIDPNWTASNGQATINAPIDAIPTGQSAFRQITFRVSPTFTGASLTNVVEIDAAMNAEWLDDQDSTPGNNDPDEDDQDGEVVTITPVFDLALEKTAVSSGPFSPGNQVSFQIKITNEGTVTARNIQIADYIPPGLVLNHPSWSASGGVATLNSLISTLAPGATVVRQITFTISANYTGTSITNAAEIRAGLNTAGLPDRDSTPNNNSNQEDDDDTATIAVQQGTAVFDLSLLKGLVTPVPPSGIFYPGDQVTFSISVTNEGNVPATYVQIADYLPDGLILADANWIPYGNIVVPATAINVLDPGQTVTVNIGLRIDESFTGDVLFNNAEIYLADNAYFMDDVDSTPGNGVDNPEDDLSAYKVEVGIPPISFDLSLQKRLRTTVTPGPFQSGSTVTFGITVRNDGDVTAHDVVITDHIPAGLTLADPEWVLSGNTAQRELPVDSLPPGGSVMVEITFVIAGDFTGTSITNRAEIAAAANDEGLPDVDSTPGNNSTQEDDDDEITVPVVQVYDLALSKTINTTLTPGPYFPGGQVTYNLTIYNQGTLTANNIVVYDYFAPGLVLNDPSWAYMGGNVLRRNSPIAQLAPGASTTVTITFTVGQVADGSTLTNCAELGSSTNVNGQPDVDSTPGNGSHDEDDDDAVDITITLPKLFDLALSKSVNTAATPGPFLPGNAVSYLITVTNEGDVVAQDIMVEDYIPTGLILTDPAWSAVGSIARRNSLIPELAPGASTTVSVSFVLSPLFTGTTLSNFAEIGSAQNPFGISDTDSTPGNGNAGPNEDDYDGATIEVLQLEFDLALSKALKSSVTPGPFIPGSTVTFQIDVVNQGDLTAQNIQIRDYFPSGLVLSDPNWVSVGNIAERITPIPSLAPGATASVDITFTISPAFSGTSLTNYAEVSSAFNASGYDDIDSTPGNGSLGPNEDDYDGATITVLQQQFDLALDKELNTGITPGPFVPGSTVTFAITVTNEGDLAAQSVQLRDYVPLGLILSDNNWTANGTTAIYNTPITNLQPGASASVNITFTIAANFNGSSITNFAEIGAATNSFGFGDHDSTPANGSAGPNEDDYDSAVIAVIQQHFDLALAKDLNVNLTPGPFVPGSTVTFLITVTNEGDLAAQNVQLRDYIPLGLNLADPNWTANGTTAIYNTPIASLQPGASASVNITFTISNAFSGTTITNYAEVGAAGNIYGLGDIDSTPGNGSAGPNEDDYDSAAITVVQEQFDLALLKELNVSATPGPFYPGSTVTFRLTVTNQGGIIAQNVQLRDYIPLGLVLADANWTANGSTATYNTPITSLAPGASTFVNITFTIDPAFVGTSITNFAEIGAASNSYGLNDVDSTPGNGAAGPNEDDYDSALINVSQQQFDLALTKSLNTSATPGPFYPGSVVTFHLALTNQGGITAQSVQLRDYIPLGLVLADANWTANGTTAIYNTPITNLAPGATVGVDITFTIMANFPGTVITNFAEIGTATNAYGMGDVDSTPGNGSAGAGEDDFDSEQITVNQQHFDLALVKELKTSATPGPFYPGSTVTFRLTVTNQGGVTAQNIGLVDYIPLGLQLADAQWVAGGGNTAVRNNAIASLAPGASASVDITFTVQAGFSGASITNYAEINSAGNTPGLNDIDSTPGNGAAGPNEDDFDSALITVTPEAGQDFDLALIKQVNTALTPGPFSPGSAVTFKITVYNQGDVDAYNVEVTDYIPTGMSLSGAGWVQSGNQAKRVIAGPIVAGGQATVDITLVISPTFGGNALINYAEISAADDDTNAGNTPPVDIDSQYDTDNTNDAGGQPNSPADDAVSGDGTGQPGSGLTATDEDDHDPAYIYVGNCNGLSAGTNGFVKLCPTCSPDNLPVDLFGALGGNPSTGGTWINNSGVNVSLADPTNVDFAGVSPGTYTFTYTVGGSPGCPPLSAIVTVELNGLSIYSCNDQVNVSFGTSCEIDVVPDMILEGNDYCMDALNVNLIAPNGASLGNTITPAQVGQLLIAEVLDPYCGLVCWGYVSVDDHTPPPITCPVQDVGLVCADKDSIFNNPVSLAITGQPAIADNCGLNHTITFQDVMVMTPDCADQQINRVFTVTDPAGNSSQCTQVIIIRKPTLGDVVAPPALPVIACDEPYAADQNGNPLPSETGFPMVQTYFGIYPLDQTFCNLGATYQDTPPITVCDGTIKIVRTWTVLDWCASAGSAIQEYTQIIKVGDVEGPLVSCPAVDYNGDGQADPMQFSTVPYDCSASFLAPLPEVTDNCSSWEVETDIVDDQVVPITNQYGIIIGYDTITVVLASIGPNEPRQVNGIPVGCYRFRYKVTDDCNNYTVIECDFCVVDNIEPTAICNDDLHISLGGQGVARVFAESIDEGSWDNCGVDTLLVRRLIEYDLTTCEPVTPYYSDWAGYVDFSCCDAGLLVTIELKVVDVYGNENTCWLNALVEDKVKPYCLAPPSVSISCPDVPDGLDPMDTGDLQALFGVATATDDCGVATVEELPPVVNIGTCGDGTIVRYFRATDEAGNISQNTCQQLITITEEFDYEIKFPKDAVTDCVAPAPDTLLYTSFGCDLLSVSVTDEVFTPAPGSNSPECYKIFRTFRVLDWCEYDGISNATVIGRNEDCDGTPGDEDVWVLRRPNGAYIDRDNNHLNTTPAFGTKGTSCDGLTNPTGYWRPSPSVGFWEYTQIIKVMDSTPPQISFSTPDPFCSYDPVNCTGNVQYPFTVFENCDPTGIIVEVFLDADANGTPDQNLTNTGALTGAYPNYQIQGEYPLGAHAFIVQAQDGCGNNTASAILPFTVVDCEPPGFTCLNGLVFQLQPLPPGTDIDGDGNADAAGVGVWANDFVNNASDCSDDTIAYSINLMGDMPDMGQQVIYFTCEDTGTISIEVYIWDSAFNPYAIQPDGTVGGPNYSICQTYVLIQDSNNHCAAAATGPMMAGLVAREDGMGVENVEVALSGQTNLQMFTAIDGTYEFNGLDTGYDYTLAPYLNTDHRNGVSTLDLVKMQQHLLGTELLDSPYKMIAADANHSGAITTLDMIQIQQLILGIILEFPTNTSWRFVPASYIFPVPANPWFAPFPEVINVNNLNFSLMANDFVAIKIGDVNNSATVTSLQSVETRSFEGTFYLTVPERRLTKGEVVKVPFTAAQLEAMRGYQFTLEFDPDALQLEDVAYGQADEYSLGLQGAEEGYLTASWYRKGSQSDAEEEKGPELFTLSFRALGDARLSELLRISSRYTLAEAYGRDFGLWEPALSFEGVGEQAPAFRLYQNRPNPFTQETLIGFELPEAGRARLSIFDISGKLVKVYEDIFEQGYNELRIPRDGLPPGVLYYRLQMGREEAGRKMILLE